MSRGLTQRELCLNFLNNPEVHPDNPSKRLRKGKGPYDKWVKLCIENDLDVSKLDEVPTKSIIKITSPRSPVRSPIRSPKRLSDLPVRSPQKNQESFFYRQRSVFNEKEVPINSIVSSRLRPQKLKIPLFSDIYLTVDDFDNIKHLPYEQFLRQVIKITNNNGGNITRAEFDEIVDTDVLINIPKKYTSKDKGNSTVTFHDDKGISKGKLLYKLASLIVSNYPDYYYFGGLKSEIDVKNAYTLIISYEGW